MNPPNFSLLFFRKSYHFALGTIVVRPPFFNYHSLHHPLFALSCHPSLLLSVPPLPYHSPKITPSVIPQSRRPRHVIRLKSGTGHRFCSLSSPQAALTSTKRGCHPHTPTQKDIARTRLSPKRPFLYSTRRRVKSVAHSVITASNCVAFQSQAP